MKKKILLLILLIVLPVAVLSEDRLFTVYEAIVNSANDVIALCGSKNVTILKDTKITVEDEGSLEEENVMFIYNGDMCSMDSKNVSSDPSKVNLKDFKKDEKNVKTLKSLKLYSGPGYGYGSTDIIIPSGYDVTSSYYDEKYMYTEYNDVKGWIVYNSNNNLNVMEEENDKIKIVKDTMLVDPYTDNPFDIVVPANSIFTSKYVTNNSKEDITYYFEHDNELGYVNKDSVAYETAGEIVCDNPVNIYETGSAEKVVERANKDDHLKLLYETCTKNYYFVSYNGVNGWILASELGNSKRNVEYVDASTSTVENENTSNALIITGLGIAVAFLAAGLLIMVNNRKSGKKKRSIIKDL